LPLELVTLFQTFLNGLTLSVIYMLFASGFTLIFGIMGLLNFPHGPIYAFGAYVVFYVMGWLGSSFNIYGLSIILAILFCGLIGVMMERFFYRPFFGQLAQQVSIALGLSLMFSGLTLVIAGPTEKGIPPIISGSANLGGVYLPYSRLIIMTLSAVIMIGLLLLIKRTKIGYFVRAVTEDSWAAQLEGVKLTRVTMFALGLSCALAGFVGASVMTIFNLATPYMGGEVLSIALLVIMIGGLGSIPGAILGSLILGFMQSFAQTYLGGGAIAELVGFILVYIILLVRPRGLMGHE
jgi:branched-chain amino acid transport system permease protein